MRPGNFVDVEELVVSASDDAVLLRLALPARNLLREQPTSPRRERARLTLVSVIRHLPTREDPFDLLPVLVLEHDGVVGRAKEVLERPGRLLALVAVPRNHTCTALLDGKLAQLLRRRVRVRSLCPALRLALLLLVRPLRLRPYAADDESFLLSVEIRFEAWFVLAEGLELVDELGGC